MVIGKDLAAFESHLFLMPPLYIPRTYPKLVLRTRLIDLLRWAEDFRSSGCKIIVFQGGWS